MVTGALRSEGIIIGERQVGAMLRELDPPAQQQRRQNAGRSLNPRVYHAEYFGHKVHIDQNEKLVMYGVVHVCSRDGYSGMITSFATMPRKNNAIIYERVYK